MEVIIDSKDGDNVHNYSFYFNYYNYLKICHCQIFMAKVKFCLKNFHTFSIVCMYISSNDDSFA